MSKFIGLVSFAKSTKIAYNASLLQLVRSAHTVTVGSKNAPPKPRRTPLSAYQLFVKEKALNKEYGEESPVDRFRKVAAEWRDLPEQDKNVYRERSDTEKEEWMRDCAKYEAFLDSLSEVERNRIKVKELLLKATSKEKRQLSKSVADDIAAKMPKRPGSAFQLFFNEELEKGSLEGLKGPELFQTASAKWNSLDEYVKTRYKTLQKDLLKKYSEDLEAWKRI